ncbi:drs2 neo1 protein, partial [Linderina macrospora]
MSPVMRTRRLHQQNSHRRQQSLPGHAMVSRTLQQLAVTNRLNGGQQGSRVSQHSRGLSASVLRSPTAVSPAVSDDPLPRPNTPLSFNFPGTTPGTIPETETLLDHQTDTSDEAELESQVGGGAMTAESDPDLIAMDDDPRQHTRAKDDAPVSDLQLLPSSRSIMESAPPTQVFRSRAEWFLRCMALCHTVQPDRDPLTGRITGYQATSPDEKALVAAAAELGYVMNNRAGPLVQLRVVASERMRDFNEMAGAGELDGSFDRGVPAPDPTDRLGNYEVLDVLEFSSARKRMSVIYRCPDGRIIMVSKGADSALWPRLVQPNELRSDPSTTQSFMPKPAGHPLKRTLSRPSAAYLHSRTSSQASNADIDKFLKSALISTPVQARRTASRLGEESDITPSSPLLPGNFGDHLSAYESDYPTHQNVFGILRDSRDSIASSVNVMDQGQQEIPSSFETPTMEEEEWARARSLEALH